MHKRTVRVNLIIHSFAAAHALAALSLQLLGWSDELVLTALTIIMIFMVAGVYKVPNDVTAAIALLGCFAGFFMGTQGTRLLMMVTGQFDEVNAVATIAITEILGWTTYFIARRTRFKRK